MLTLGSNLQIDDPIQRLRAFCAEEYAHYDGISA
jgi:hypothetical protein